MPPSWRAAHRTPSPSTSRRERGRGVSPRTRLAASRSSTTTSTSSRSGWRPSMGRLRPTSPTTSCVPSATKARSVRHAVASPPPRSPTGQGAAGCIGPGCPEPGMWFQVRLVRQRASHCRHEDVAVLCLAGIVASVSCWRSHLDKTVPTLISCIDQCLPPLRWRAHLRIVR